MKRTQVPHALALLVVFLLSGWRVAEPAPSEVADIWEIRVTLFESQVLVRDDVWAFVAVSNRSTAACPMPVVDFWLEGEPDHDHQLPTLSFHGVRTLEPAGTFFAVRRTEARDLGRRDAILRVVASDTRQALPKLLTKQWSVGGVEVIEPHDAADRDYLQALVASDLPSAHAFYSARAKEVWSSIDVPYRLENRGAFLAACGWCDSRYYRSRTFRRLNWISTALTYLANGQFETRVLFPGEDGERRLQARLADAKATRAHLDNAAERILVAISDLHLLLLEHLAGKPSSKAAVAEALGDLNLDLSSQVTQRMLGNFDGST